MTRSGFAAFLAATLIAVPAGMALSESNVSDVSDEVQRQGFFVERGTSVNAQQAGDLVAAARNAGEELFLVFLADEPTAGATFFAESVVNDLPSGMVLVVAPDTVGYAGRSMRATERELSFALDEALNIGSSDFDVASTFVGALPGVALGGGSTSTPATTPKTSSGGGGSWILWIILIAIAAGGFLLFLNSRKPRSSARQDSALTKARAEVGKMLSAVANDILDMEEEVRSADNERVDRFYQDASATYAKSTKSFEDATNAQQLLDLSNDLELATWQLDFAEAILDGNEPPPRPELKRFQPPVPVPSETRAPTGRPSQAMGARPLPPRPNYICRPARRSAPLGDGLVDLLSGLLASGALTGLGGGRSRPRRTRARVLPTRSRSRFAGRTSTRRSPRSGGVSGKRVRGGGRRRK